MRSIKTAIFYGFLVWLIPFVVAIFIFPIRQADRALFESIMPVVLTLSIVVFSVKYFRVVNGNYLTEAVRLGLVWLVISLGIDLLLFMQGPMKMTPLDYFKDIGLIYLIIPVVTIGFGYLKAR